MYPRIYWWECRLLEQFTVHIKKPKSKFYKLDFFENLMIWENAQDVKLNERSRNQDLSLSLNSSEKNPALVVVFHSIIWASRICVCDPSFGLPCWLTQYRAHLQCRRPGSDPWVGKIPWRRAWQPTPVFLPGESPRTEEPGGLQSLRSQRVGHD